VREVRVTPQRLEKFREGLFQANDLSQELTECEIEELSKLVPQLDVVTRWSSVFFMIERALKLRQGLDYAVFVIKELRVTHLIQPDEWLLLEEIFEFLKPFADSTRHMEGCRYPTVTRLKQELRIVPSLLIFSRRKRSRLQRGARRLLGGGC